MSATSDDAVPNDQQSVASDVASWMGIFRGTHKPDPEQLHGLISRWGSVKAHLEGSLQPAPAQETWEQQRGETGRLLNSHLSVTAATTYLNQDSLPDNSQALQEALLQTPMRSRVKAMGSRAGQDAVHYMEHSVSSKNLGDASRADLFIRLVTESEAQLPGRDDGEAYNLFLNKKWDMACKLDDAMTALQNKRVELATRGHYPESTAIGIIVDSMRIARDHPTPGVSFASACGTALNDAQRTATLAKHRGFFSQILELLGIRTDSVRKVDDMRETLQKLRDGDDTPSSSVTLS